uniref:Reverse transcriptase/retrotransposon-derived protein RNase H-like domain-containing protein n=1 Tax=Cynoglossus semilaevis TaxID=244447 RepID=A0A3P8V8R4_CYNSE
MINSRKKLSPERSPMSSAPATKITLQSDHLRCIAQLKTALQSVVCLKFPDYSKPFDLYCDSKDGHMTAVLTQKHGPSQRPLCYYPIRLDNVAAGLPPFTLNLQQKVVSSTLLYL